MLYVNALNMPFRFGCCLSFTLRPPSLHKRVPCPVLGQPVGSDVVQSVARVFGKLYGFDRLNANEKQFTEFSIIRLRAAIVYQLRIGIVPKLHALSSTSISLSVVSISSAQDH